MNDDSMTIDRIQVEFSTNLDPLIASLHTAESRIDAVNNSFARTETASEPYAASMERARTAAATSSEGEGIFTMAGGSIIGNTATTCGGVYGTYTKTGGQVIGNSPQE